MVSSTRCRGHRRRTIGFRRLRCTGIVGTLDSWYRIVRGVGGPLVESRLRRGSWARGALNTSAQVSPFAGPCTPRSRRGTATHPTFQAILGGWLTRLQMARVASGHLHRLSLYVYHRRLPLPCAALRGNLRHLTLRHRHSLVQRRAALVVHLCALLLRSMVTVALLHLTYLPRLALLAMACSRDRLLAARLSLRTRLRLCRARLRPLRAPPNTPTPRPMVAAALTRHRPLISRLALLALVHLWEHLLVPLILLTNLIHHLNRLLTPNRQPSRAVRASPLHHFPITITSHGSGLNRLD